MVDDVTVNQTDNVTGREFTSATLSSTNWQYACSCSAGKAVKLVYMVSPVLTTTGHQTGYYKLNDSLDIKTMLLRLILDSSMVRSLPPAMPCQTVLLQ
ncbi:gyraK [Escherichia coli EC1846]|nr:putative fimbrial protein [Escherichia coli DEC3E]EHV09587.1 putative fimbrial protein [Escherichia coli DEC4E]EIN58182.1 gyraK [Escherichia coli PA9]EIN68816.1 gyraK [Escherichia coli PA10]EIN98096.1 gyraK [Escherichia coli PA28]EIO33093.1 gyraK [Escherichia coli PA39]EIO55114.1 gyraK [Escherichia coli TW07945]EIO69609.1 gyraK [Escherichia coli TW09098]EIO90010.1 gyraK [Escherichia coli EC4203]EIP07132.1 gyraK [Escherichia coli O157:H7 str. TW14313]EIP30226.1 gyraK [Escherichia coli E